VFTESGEILTWEEDGAIEARIFPNNFKLIFQWHFSFGSYSRGTKYGKKFIGSFEGELTVAHPPNSLLK
jgi:hypothetical protein